MSSPVIRISSDGKTSNAIAGLLSLEVKRELNRIPSATLVLVAEPSSDSSSTEVVSLNLGSRVSIELRYPDEPTATTVFEGVVVRNVLDLSSSGATRRVELKDPVFALTRRRKSSVYRNLGDDMATRKLLEDAQLKVGVLAHTPDAHVELVQYNVTDWDFLLARADVRGLVVDAHRGAVSTHAIAVGAGVVVAIRPGASDVYELELELDASDQWAQASSRAWDPGQQQATSAQQARQPDFKWGELDAVDLARRLGGDSLTLHSSGTHEPAELEAWANARLLRSRFALIRGRAVVRGNAARAPLDTVEVDNLAGSFSGRVLVSGVTQRIDDDGWRTELQLGLSPEWFARKPDIAEVPAAGLLPPICNLQIGVVAAFEEDPRGEQRIKVSLPALEPSEGAIWARLARPDAGNERGFVFWPEPKDEVVVGFIDGDPRQAIVLGALHGSAHKPAKGFAPSERNDARAIVSRTGSRIVFDDGKRTVSLEAQDNQGNWNRVVLDGEKKSISLSDAQGNSVVLNDQGIVVKSAGALTLEAQGKVTVRGSAVELQ